MKRDAAAQERRNALFFVAIQLLLVGAACFMRFYRLAEIPAGLHADEAYEGLDAYALLAKPVWDWPLFFTGINGREPLFVYLLALSQRLLGPSLVALRAVAAAIGVLLTPAMAWLAWELASALGVRARRRFALWAAAGTLALLWSQMFSRIAIRNGLFVLVEVLLWAALWRAWRRSPRPGEGKALGWWAVAGVLAGLSIYTYLPARLLPAVLLPLAVWTFLHDRRRLRQNGLGIGVALATAILVSAPLAVYFARHPDAFFMRTAQVSVLDQGGVAAVVKNVGPVLGMPFWTGDQNVRVNLPGRPVLDWFTLLPFLLGILLLLRRFRRPGSLFLLSALGVMLLPTLLSEDPPNFGRAIGALPIFVLLIAWGLDQLARWGERLWPRGKHFYTALGWTLLLSATLLSWRVYFVQWVGRPDLFPWWDEGYTRLARDIAAIPGTTEANAPLPRVYISPRGAEHATVRYLLLDSPMHPQGFDGRVCLRVATDRPARYYFLTNEDYRGQGLLGSYLPDSRAQPAVLDAYGQTWARVLAQPAGGTVTFPEMIPHPQTLGDGIELLGYWLSQPQLQPGQRLYVRLFWRVRAQPGHSYTAFVHLLGRNPAGDLDQLAGADAVPGAGSCTTDDWLPGEVVVDELQFVLPEELPAAGGNYLLEVGFYTQPNLQRLEVVGNADNRILIGPLPTMGAAP